MDHVDESHVGLALLAAAVALAHVGTGGTGGIALRDLNTV